MTPTSNTTNGLALIALLVVAIQSVIGVLWRPSPARPGSIGFMLFTLFFALALWSMCLWKLWKRPRRWSLGLGIFFTCMLAFQIFLWHRAVTSPRLVPGLDYSLLHFALYEIPLVAAITLCFLLRRQLSQAKTAQPAVPSP